MSTPARIRSAPEVEQRQRCDSGGTVVREQKTMPIVMSTSAGEATPTAHVVSLHEESTPIAMSTRGHTRSTDDAEDAGVPNMRSRRAR